MKYLILSFPLLILFNLQAQVTFVAAHRGQASSAPENSMRGIKNLLPTGIKYIEVDIRTSKDSILVIMHDASLKRTTKCPAQTNELTFKELKQLTMVGGKKKDRIPSLSEVCNILKNWNDINTKRQVNLYVDCKDAHPKQLIETLLHYGLLDNAVFYAKDSYLLELRKLHPTIKIIAALKKTDDLDNKITELRPFAFDIPFPILTKELVDKIHGHRIEVFSDLLFNFDNNTTYKQAKAMNVNVIQTDRANKALHALKVFKAQ